ncbi:SDR family mycofactocin-dependent oxidoreductase [Rhodococcus sp. RS1C4]|nr:mycofactocin-coupled SDR family oxidoreductase [Rhodococcus sp. RS1C4]OZC42692.1 SDR family mycofactocin-dependent oxidoreductase [Rhodococcus sp. RS1C4]
MGNLDGQVVLITGAARGQGRSHALRLAREGADIIAVDACSPIASIPYPAANSDDLATTVAEVEALDRRIVAKEVDIRDLASLEQAVSAGVNELGRLDVVIANAGILSMAQTLEMSEDTWDEMIDINLTGQWKTIRAAAPHIVAGARGGSIVFTSSLATMITSENLAHYTAAKAGVVGLMRVLAKELAPLNIRVNTVHPTTVGTAMVQNEAMYRLFRPDLEKPGRSDFEEVVQSLQGLPVATIEPIDVSNAIYYLVSDSGRYITGTEHIIDPGGRL